MKSTIIMKKYAVDSTIQFQLNHYKLASVEVRNDFFIKITDNLVNPLTTGI